MAAVVTFGEAMLRLAPPAFQRLEQTGTLEVVAGGGEYNVAVAVSRLGLSVAWVSRLPDNPLGRRIRNQARAQGVDTQHLVWTHQDRVGLYWMEFGAAPRASSVLYDRAGSAISRIQPGEVPWDTVLKGCRLFHVSGITPALSPSAAEVTGAALQAARRAGCLVSYDLNYRSKLWTEEQARAVQEPYMEYVDILITTEEDTRKVFGISSGAGANGTFNKVDPGAYATVAQTLAERFQFRQVAITLRENAGVWHNRWSAILWSDNQLHAAPWYEVEVVDRVGAGDSFSAGLIYGLLERNDAEYALRFGVALSALKHSIPGDLAWIERSEVEALLSGGGLRINR